MTDKQGKLSSLKIEIDKLIESGISENEEYDYWLECNMSSLKEEYSNYVSECSIGGVTADSFEDYTKKKYEEMNA